MKTDPSRHHDEPLRKLLKEWRADAALPLGFQEAVWRRIDRAHAPTAHSIWAVVAHWISTMLHRPALGVSYVVVLLAIGMTAGWAQGRLETARVRDELGQRYVHVLDPYQAPRP